MPIIFGTIVLGIGIVRVVYGFLTYRQEEDARHNITLGVLDIIWGIIMLVLLDKASAFSIMFGIWCLIGAVLEFSEMAREILAKKAWVGLLVDGVVNLCFGVVLMANNWAIDATFNRFAGIYLLLNAFSTILITLLAIKREEIAVAEKAVEVKAEPVVEVVEQPAAPVEEPKAEVVEAKPAAKKAPAKKATTTKTTATKSTTAKKSTATKSTAAKTTAPKAATKTSTAKKTSTTSTAAKKTTATKKSTPKAE